MAERTIDLSDRNALMVPQFERLASGAITPGMVVELISTDKVRANTSVKRNALFVAIENLLYGKTISDAYSDGDLVFFKQVPAGGKFYGLLTIGESVVIGDRLVKNSAGGSLDKVTARATASATVASTATGVTNSITITAAMAGAIGNSIKLSLIDPYTATASATGGTPASVTVEGLHVKVTLACGDSGAPTTTPAQLAALIAADAEASSLMTITHATGATDPVSAVTAQALSGGADGDEEHVVAIATEAVDNSAGTAAARIIAQVI